jgi:hypothetical protein
MVTSGQRRTVVRSIADMRRALSVVVAGAVVLLTAGCTVPGVAVSGIGVDTQGNPVGYLQVCQDHIDGATVYIDDTHKFGNWESVPAATGFATWSLADPGGPGRQTTRSAS